jgi:DNA mismatch repair protein MutS
MESVPSPAESSSILLKHFGVQSLAPFGCDGQPQVTQAAAALLNYLAKTSRGGLSHITTLKTYSPSSSLRLDPFTLEALEVADSRGPGERTPTLLSSLDKTVSGPGSRVLRNWLLRPLVDGAAINARFDAVAWLTENERLLTGFRELASSCPDLERIASRIGGRNANARDLVATRNALDSIRKIRAQLSVPGFPAVLAEALSSMEPVPELEELLAKSIADNPPAVLTEGEIIRDGWNAEVDELRGLSKHGKDKLMEVQARERERTGIENLRIQYNSVFGYFIEVSKGKADRVPSDYHRKQTLTGAERFITPELKELESKILGATERLEKLERELFTEILGQAAKHVGALLSSGRAMGTIDALSSFALVALKRGYVRPVVETGAGLEIVEGRHPVLEQLVSPFVSNDIRIIPGEETVLVITGPNMAGKSTYLRQNALIALMAHAGSFVPAKTARIGLFDGIYCRIGASDKLTRGQSTFMVEMTEVAHILNHATKNSLLVFDEVGRGTSTYDGISIAWSILEHVAQRIGAGTLFATHYYELTALAGTVPGVRNYNVLVREWKNELVFLYKIVPGRADRSYGVQVAKLAGITTDVLTRARELLQTFEKKKVMDEQDATGQMALFGAEARDEIANILRGVEPERMTPVQALTLLSDLKDRLGDGSRAGEGNA